MVIPVRDILGKIRLDAPEAELKLQIEMQIRALVEKINDLETAETTLRRAEEMKACNEAYERRLTEMRTNFNDEVRRAVADEAVEIAQKLILATQGVKKDDHN
jgi:phosphoglycolate phosphatase-like HAD superfamily hydrolase